MKKILFILFFIPAGLYAQAPLSLRSAIDSALKNNYEIRIAANDYLISKSNNHYGVAGGMPYITAGVNDEPSLRTTDQHFSTAPDSHLDNVFGNALNSDITAGIVLFNGMKITAAKHRLALLEQQNQYLLNDQIQSVMSDVMIAYYDILRQQSYLNILQHSLDVSNQKMSLMNTRKEVGMASGVDILQAQMDVNASRESCKAQEVVITQAKAELLRIMACSSLTDFALTDSIVPFYGIVLDTVLASITRNPLYLSALTQEQVSRQVVREVSAQRYPSLKMSASYDFSQADNNAGYTLMNRVYGPSAQLSLQIPIYNGGIVRAQRRSAMITADNAGLEKESMMLSLRTDAVKTWQAYQSGLEQLDEQRQSFELSKQLLDLVMKNFSENHATYLDVKNAQLTYETAANRLISLEYAVKVAEIRLKSLMYQLKYE